MRNWVNQPTKWHLLNKLCRFVNDTKYTFMILWTYTNIDLLQRLVLTLFYQSISLRSDCRLCECVCVHACENCEKRRWKLQTTTTMCTVCRNTSTDTHVDRGTDSLFVRNSSYILMHRIVIGSMRFAQLLRKAGTFFFSTHKPSINIFCVSRCCIKGTFISN